MSVCAIDSCNLMFDGANIFEEQRSKSKAKPKSRFTRVKKNEEAVNPFSTYLLLAEGTYYEIQKKDAIRLTNEELTAFACLRWGLKSARELTIIRPTAGGNK